MTAYCGNNSKNSRLLNGDLLPGSRYNCLRKGIGIGRKLPYDSEYNNEYDPIDKTKIYCGNKNILPNGYDRMGSNVECLRKGIGVGKKMRASNDSSPSSVMNFSNKYKIFSFIFLCILFFIILVFAKPNFILDKSVEKEKEKKISFSKFFIYYLIICLILFFIIFFPSKLEGIFKFFLY